jgi:hypothetical protein
LKIVLKHIQFLLLLLVVINYVVPVVYGIDTEWQQTAMEQTEQEQPTEEVLEKEDLKESEVQFVIPANHMPSMQKDITVNRGYCSSTLNHPRKLFTPPPRA